MRRLSLASLAPTMVVAAALSGCIPATPRPEAPPPARTAPQPALPAPRAVLGADWRDWPLTPGDWRYQRTAQGSVAVFGAAGMPRLSLSCDPRARQIRLDRPAAVAGAVTIRTSSLTRTLTLRAAATGAETTIAANDSLLDAMAFSRGRFTVEQSGHMPLVIPAYAEIGRVIEDCRG
ncbi:hypothetical protein NZL82_06495 [Sphingomonas sanguinis]|uniref:hypothetical protein n=1 Tax=Sphingomonas sp. LC-1 TaxID=3110957 RepID=UPI0021BA6797|nr:hypothetical protein [Sphingomonas sp. LC-1]MCT8001528.1 hypothetical protein [Sphingomonas sp. LC-1]